MANKANPEPSWLLFRITLPLDYCARYEVIRRCESATGAVWCAAEIAGTEDDAVIGILEPSGRISRIGPGCYRLPTSLRGAVDGWGRVVLGAVPN